MKSLSIISVVLIVHLLMISSCGYSPQGNNKQTPQLHEMNDDSLFSFITDSALEDTLNSVLLLAENYNEYEQLNMISLSFTETDSHVTVFLSPMYRLLDNCEKIHKVAAKESGGYSVIVFFESSELFDESILSESKAFEIIGEADFYSQFIDYEAVGLLREYKRDSRHEWGLESESIIRLTPRQEE